MSTHDPIAIALAEDIGPGDATVEFFIDPQGSAAARIFAKEKAVVAGAAVAAETLARVDPSLVVNVERGDGSAVVPGDTVLTIQGRAGSILTGERVALNFLQRLSGVATQTRRFVDAVAGTRAQILDTRKTTPGLRALEKAAVLAGGGHNHRMGLYDMVMVKDNHLLADPDLQAAVDRAKAARPELRIEMEADNLGQVYIFLGPAWRGCNPARQHEARRPARRPSTSAAPRVAACSSKPAGGVTIDTVRAIAETGVQWISVGALTHSARAIDFSLEFLP